MGMERTCVPRCAKPAGGSAVAGPLSTGHAKPDRQGSAVPLTKAPRAKSKGSAHGLLEQLQQDQPTLWTPTC